MAIMLFGIIFLLAGVGFILIAYHESKPKTQAQLFYQGVMQDYLSDYSMTPAMAVFAAAASFVLGIIVIVCC